MNDKRQELRDLKHKIYQDMIDGRQTSDYDLERLDQLMYQTGLTEEIDLDEKSLPAPSPKATIKKSPFSG